MNFKHCLLGAWNDWLLIFTLSHSRNQLLSLWFQHFVRFLNYLRVQEVLRSIQSLRESHDHMNEYSHRIHMTPDKICIPVDDVSKATRYAPLNLVALLAAFGHRYSCSPTIKPILRSFSKTYSTAREWLYSREEAEAALLEAVSKAQNAGDDFALQNALCWLCRISPPGLRVILNCSSLKSVVLVFVKCINASYQYWLNWIDWIFHVSGKMQMLSYLNSMVFGWTDVEPSYLV